MKRLPYTILLVVLAFTFIDGFIEFVKTTDPQIIFKWVPYIPMIYIACIIPVGLYHLVIGLFKNYRNKKSGFVLKIPACILLNFILLITLSYLFDDAAKVADLTNAIEDKGEISAIYMGFVIPVCYEYAPVAESQTENLI